jgi:CMP-N-acetylneuraminic acid synthetase
MPLRGGSKSIPGKNIKALAGQPLFAWSLGAAVASGIFDAVYVATDCSAIAAAVAQHAPSVTVLDRAPETATDIASSESVLLEFDRCADYDVVCLIQATSPLTEAQDFVTAKQRFVEHKCDSLVTAVHSTEFLWSASGEAQNYDPQCRPRRQDATGHFIENGAFYFTTRHILQRDQCRLGGKVAVHPMASATRIEIDELADWPIVEQLLLARTPSAS